MLSPHDKFLYEQEIIKLVILRDQLRDMILNLLQEKVDRINE